MIVKGAQKDNCTTCIAIPVSTPNLLTIASLASERFYLGEKVAEMRLVKCGEDTRHGAGLEKASDCERGDNI
jgi:hypothetical protein